MHVLRVHTIGDEPGRLSTTPVALWTTWGTQWWRSPFRCGNGPPSIGGRAGARGSSRERRRIVTPGCFPVPGLPRPAAGCPIVPVSGVEDRHRCCPQDPPPRLPRPPPRPRSSSGSATTGAGWGGRSSMTRCARSRAGACSGAWDRTTSRRSGSASACSRCRGSRRWSSGWSWRSRRAGRAGVRPWRPMRPRPGR
jgi:hypothetical protein